MNQNCELRWTVALEAALFFSLPSWVLIANPAWPADGPYQFSSAVLIGATTALVLCHVVPATCAGAPSLMSESRIWRVVLWPVGAWLCLGAATSLGQMAQLSGSMSVLWRDSDCWHQPAPSMWKIIAVSMTLVCVMLSMVLAWQGIQRQRPLIASCLALGVCLAVASFGAQLPGLGARNPYLISEQGLDAPFGVVEGMLIASAPASILALRIGRMGVSSRGIWRTGMYGVWVPLVTSVAFVSMAKMCGTRLNWRPSLPIEATASFPWLFRLTHMIAGILWPLALTILVPCLICAIWVRALTRICQRIWQKLLVFSGLTAAAYVLMSSFPWAPYYKYWLWSILVCNLLLAVAWLLLRNRLMSPPDELSRPPFHGASSPSR